MKWWEKTVEYTFVIYAAVEKIFDLIVPLDGDVEVIGDTVICKDSVYFIIEFKKSLDDFPSEYTKYKNGKTGYLLAVETMKNNPASKAHFIVGGRESENRKQLSIEIRNYFEPEAIPHSDIAQILNNGINREQLTEYTKKLSYLKKRENDDSSDGSSTGGFTYQNVLAVSMSNKRASLIPLNYFITPSPKKESKMSYKIP